MEYNFNQLPGDMNLPPGIDYGHVQNMFPQFPDFPFYPPQSPFHNMGMPMQPYRLMDHPGFTHQLNQPGEIPPLMNLMQEGEPEPIYNPHHMTDFSMGNPIQIQSSPIVSDPRLRNKQQNEAPTFDSRGFRTHMGVVTQFNETHGMIDNDVFFQAGVVTGRLPLQGERVVVTAEPVTGMPFNWNAKMVRVEATALKSILKKSCEPLGLNELLGSAQVGTGGVPLAPLRKLPPPPPIISFAKNKEAYKPDEPLRSPPRNYLNSGEIPPLTSVTFPTRIAPLRSPENIERTAPARSPERIAPRRSKSPSSKRPRRISRSPEVRISRKGNVSSTKEDNSSSQNRKQEKEDSSNKNKQNPSTSSNKKSSGSSSSGSRSENKTDSQTKYPLTAKQIIEEQKKKVIETKVKALVAARVIDVPDQLRQIVQPTQVKAPVVAPAPPKNVTKVKKLISVKDKSYQICLKMAEKVVGSKEVKKAEASSSNPNDKKQDGKSKDSINPNNGGGKGKKEIEQSKTGGNVNSTKEADSSTAEKLLTPENSKLRNQIKQKYEVEKERQLRYELEDYKKRYSKDEYLALEEKLQKREKERKETERRIFFVKSEHVCRKMIYDEVAYTENLLKRLNEDRPPKIFHREKSLEKKPEKQQEKRRGSKERLRSRDRSRERVRDRSRDRIRDRSRDRLRDRSRDRSGEKVRERSRDRIRDRSLEKVRDRSRDRIRNRSRDRIRDRSRDRSKRDRSRSDERRHARTRDGRSERESRFYKRSRSRSRERRRSRSPQRFTDKDNLETRYEEDYGEMAHAALALRDRRESSIEVEMMKVEQEIHRCFNDLERENFYKRVLSERKNKLLEIKALEQLEFMKNQMTTALGPKEIFYADEDLVVYNYSEKERRTEVEYTTPFVGTSENDDDWEQEGSFKIKERAVATDYNSGNLCVTRVFTKEHDPYDFVERREMEELERTERFDDTNLRTRSISNERVTFDYDHDDANSGHKVIEYGHGENAYENAESSNAYENAESSNAYENLADHRHRGSGERQSSLPHSSNARFSENLYETKRKIEEEIEWKRKIQEEEKWRNLEKRHFDIMQVYAQNCEIELENKRKALQLQEAELERRMETFERQTRQYEESKKNPRFNKQDEKNWKMVIEKNMNEWETEFKELKEKKREMDQSQSTQSQPTQSTQPPVKNNKTRRMEQRRGLQEAYKLAHQMDQEKSQPSNQEKSTIEDDEVEILAVKSKEGECNEKYEILPFEGNLSDISTRHQYFHGTIEYNVRFANEQRKNLLCFANYDHEEFSDYFIFPSNFDKNDPPVKVRRIPLKLPTAHQFPRGFEGKRSASWNSNPSFVPSGNSSKKAKPQCYNCKKRTHFIAQCPNDWKLDSPDTRAQPNPPLNHN